MKMRYLTGAEIDTLAARKGVKGHVVANYLASMGDDPMAADINLTQDAKSYKWNAATVKAIRDGILLAKRPIAALTGKTDVIRRHAEESGLKIVDIKLSES
jgi:hypothetical protein